MGQEVAVITDGLRRRDASASPSATLLPEAALGGPLALVLDGDLIEIDVEAGRIDLLVSEAELAERRAAYRPRAPRYASGVLAKYANAARVLAACLDAAGRRRLTFETAQHRERRLPTWLE